MQADQRIGITPSVLRGDNESANCELTPVCIDAQMRKPRSFPPEVAARAKEIL
jgi:acyl-CoA thioesterase FadM